MSDVTYPVVSSDWLKFEAHPHNIGRQNIKIVSGTGAVVSGTVLMDGAVDGEFLPCTAASTPTGILIDGVNATDGDVMAVQVIWEAEIIATALTYGADVDTDVKKKTIRDALETDNKIFSRAAV